MDNVRLLLTMALVFLGMLIWEAWEKDYGAGQQPQAEEIVATKNQTADMPDTPAVASIDDVSSKKGFEASTQESQSKGQAKHIEVKTDMFRLIIDSRGGTIISAWLEKYPVSLDTPDKKYNLLNTNPYDFFIVQSGLISADKSIPSPSHDAIFTSSNDTYELADNEDSLNVDLTWVSDEGIEVTKRYTFTRGSHKVGLQHIINNNSEKDWRGREYRQLKRGVPSDEGNFMMYTYTGGAVYSPEEKYQKYDFDELGEGQLDKDVTGGWLAMIQHYFLTAFVPNAEDPVHFYGKALSDGRYAIGAYTAAAQIRAGQSHSFSGKLFIGPKLQSELAELAPGLDLTVDYGWLAFIAQPMWWILDWIHSGVGNWGWAIIIFTILIKLAFYKLSETSYKSMANMRKLTPRIQALKDRYGDDKQRMQQAMMEIYKKEKINPLGGCLPMLLQMPFFIALYWVLLESVELRQAPWILWINDLSLKDPYFVLPILMGASMLIQQKLNPPPPDPMQAKMMMILPIVFTVMFAFFPSGLVLYWFVNNLLSIAQQWVITRRIEQGEKA